MKNRCLLALLAAASVVASACAGFEHNSSLTGPSASGNNSLLGAWTSSTLIPTPSTCTEFVWNVSEQTATTAKGSFSATCPGDLRVTGTAEGGFTNPTTISWNATGIANASGLVSCGVTLSGTATLGTDSITVPYSGDTCLGKVSGIETLRKR